MNILIFALVEVFAVIGLIVFGMQRKLKRAEKEIERLTKVATKYKNKCTEMEIMTMTTPVEVNLTEQEKEQKRIKLRMEGLQNMMNYDIKQALGGK